MRKIILNVAVTLDGFIEGPNGEIDWCQADESAEMGEGSAFDKFLAGIDTIFYGRVSYDLWGQYLPAENTPAAEKHLWDTVHRKKKYVFSRHSKPDGTATFISGDITTRVNAIKAEAGKDIWLYGGTGITTSFINAGLVDACLLAVHPVILGAGRPLFSGLQNRVNLELNKIIPSKSGVVLMDYRVIKNV